MNKTVLFLLILIIVSAGLLAWKYSADNSSALTSKFFVRPGPAAQSTPSPEATSSEPVIATTTKEEAPVASMQILNQSVSQGDALNISFTNAMPQSVTFNGKPMFTFGFLGTARAIAPISPTLSPGNYLISAKLTNGETIQKSVYVRKYNFVIIPTPNFAPTTTPEMEAQLEAESLDFHSTFNRPPEIADFASTFVLPLHTPIKVTSTFGELRIFEDGTQSRHLGVDLAAPVGTPIFAVNNGTVIKVKDYLDYGNTVIIDHGAGIFSVYLHLSKVEVQEGEQISRNQEIGLSGATGFVSGPHLHLSIRIGDTSVDPLRFFPVVNK